MEKQGVRQAQGRSSFSNVLSWRNHATKLLGKIESREEVSEDLLISLWESAHFFSVLKNAEYKFYGTLHCEASLASLKMGPKLSVMS